MLRLTLVSRVAMIVFVSLAAVWIITIAAFYRSHAEEAKTMQPPPLRIAALARLMETTDATQRTLIVDAFRSHFFRVRLIPAGATMSAKGDSAVGEDISRPFAAALDGRPLQMLNEADSRMHWLPRALLRLPRGLEFRIGLRTGETLIVDAHHGLSINRFGLPVGFGAGFFGTVVALIALLMMHHEAKPLERLAAAVDQVDLSGNPVALSQARRGAPEIRALVAAFNRLQMRLGGMLRARMALIGGISHDVRTFATRLRLRVDAIPDDLERQRAVADIDDMIRLLDDALLSSRAGAGELLQELVEIAAVVEAEVEDRQAQSGLVTFSCNCGGRHACILGDRLALRRIVGNLIDNALKYGHAAYLEIELRGDRVMLIVDDEGPGIPHDQCDLMLEPFSRLETSRSRETGGAGLGLAVVRTLTEAHGGKIELQKAPSGGARAILSLPIFQQ